MYKGSVQIKSRENIIGSLVMVVIILVGLLLSFTYALARGIDSRDAYYCRTAITTQNVEYLQTYCRGEK